MIRSSYWKLWPKNILGNRLKILEEHFYIFTTWKNVQFSAWSICMQSFSSFDKEIKILVASQKRDRFPVGQCRAVLGRDLNPVQYKLKSNFLHFVQSWSLNKHVNCSCFLNLHNLKNYSILTILHIVGLIFSWQCIPAECLYKFQDIANYLLL